MKVQILILKEHNDKVEQCLVVHLTDQLHVLGVIAFSDCGLISVALHQTLACYRGLLHSLHPDLGRFRCFKGLLNPGHGNLQVICIELNKTRAHNGNGDR